MLRVLDIRSVSFNGHDRGKSEGRTFGKVDRMRESFRGGLAFFSFSFVNRYDERVATVTNAFVFAARYKMLPAQQMLLICLCGKWSGSMLCVCLLLVTWSWSHVPAVHTLQHDYTSRCSLHLANSFSMPNWPAPVGNIPSLKLHVQSCLRLCFQRETFPVPQVEAMCFSMHWKNEYQFWDFLIFKDYL